MHENKRNNDKYFIIFKYFVRLSKGNALCMSNVSSLTAQLHRNKCICLLKNWEDPVNQHHKFFFFKKRETHTRTVSKKVHCNLFIENTYVVGCATLRCANGSYSPDFSFCCNFFSAIVEPKVDTDTAWISLISNLWRTQRQKFSVTKSN